ncbi:MAG TPA: hypothetical protein VNF47_26725 [Streptosporangiaceae bacterium]|nr:hypothetical protein [Streptosporangiaceae bacterium]
MSRGPGASHSTAVRQGEQHAAVRRYPRDDIRLARQVVHDLGGRYSAELGIDVDAGDGEIERWFLAATLFGARISAKVAERTYRVLTRAGLTRIAQARQMPSGDLIGLLDEGGYARYDFRTATQLTNLSEVMTVRYDGQVAMIGQRFTSYPALRVALDALPGWGPVTIGLFLRELRGVWPGASPPLDERATAAARHLGLKVANSTLADMPGLSALAAACDLDVRDLESGLVRLALAHRNTMASCPGLWSCAVLHQQSLRDTE